MTYIYLSLFVGFVSILLSVLCLTKKLDAILPRVVDTTFLEYLAFWNSLTRQTQNEFLAKKQGYIKLDGEWCGPDGLNIKTLPDLFPDAIKTFNLTNQKQSNAVFFSLYIDGIHSELKDIGK